ncbi:MAG: type II toxin-antitoxin system VapC family toxin [Planctomycetes bacterium]|nr:type II toxin-antitoxin system VapC family toxin [Planctomycetota bacterium]
MILADTNVLARLIQPAHRHPQAAVGSVSRPAVEEGEEFAVSLHSLYELYFIITKPVASNGFGYAAKRACAEMAALETLFLLLPETSTAYQTWKGLLEKYGPVNRRCFDAKLIANMMENGIRRILTFNDHDFRGFAEIATLNPFDRLGVRRVP